jgi:hypothetical protein
VETGGGSTQIGREGAFWNGTGRGRERKRMGRDKNWPAVELDGEEGGREGERGSRCRRRVGVVWKEVDLRVSLRAVPWLLRANQRWGITWTDNSLFLSLLSFSSSLFLAARHILCSLPYTLNYQPA